MAEKIGIKPNALKHNLISNQLQSQLVLFSPSQTILPHKKQIVKG